MSRRTLTLLLASLLVVVLTGGAVSAQVPYVALGPGPTYNTLGEVDGTDVIVVDGRRTFPTEGRLDLTTVGVTTRLTLLEALRDWFDRDLAVVPRDVVYPPGKSDEQVNAENTAAMQASQNSAVTAAARELGLRVSAVSVAALADGSPAAGLLEVDDLLLSVDGTAVRDAAELRALITAGGVGQTRAIGYERAGVPGTAQVVTRGSDVEGREVAVIGVSTTEEPVELPFEIDITLEEVGGPSAGLMFSLGILEKLGEASLTGGRYIAGTGEITASGEVGPIGGIPQKLVAAQAKGVEVFLVPADNCAEALLRPPPDLPLVRVETLASALTALEAIERGDEPILCSSPAAAANG